MSDQSPREGFDGYTRLIAGSWQEAVNAESWSERLLMIEFVWLTTAFVPAFLTTMIVQIVVGPVPLSGFAVLSLGWGLALYIFAWWYPDVRRDNVMTGNSEA